MKLRTVVPTALATGVAALGLGAVGALAQEDRERSAPPAPQEQRDDHGRMMADGDQERMMRSMDRHHDEMVREMREMDPGMARMMDRQHDKMMGQMPDSSTGGTDRE